MFETYKDVMSVDDVCCALSMGKNTLYRLLKNGAIKSIKVGRKYFIPKTCLIEFINTFTNTKITI